MENMMANPPSACGWDAKDQFMWLVYGIDLLTFIANATVNHPNFDVRFSKRAVADHPNPRTASLNAVYNIVYYIVIFIVISVKIIN